MTINSTVIHDGIRAEADLSRIAGRLSDIANSRFDLVANQSALYCKGTDRLVVDLGTPQITDQRGDRVVRRGPLHPHRLASGGRPAAHPAAIS